MSEPRRSTTDLPCATGRGVPPHRLPGKGGLWTAHQGLVLRQDRVTLLVIVGFPGASCVLFSPSFSLRLSMQQGALPSLATAREPQETGYRVTPCWQTEDRVAGDGLCRPGSPRAEDGLRGQGCPQPTTVFAGQGHPRPSAVFEDRVAPDVRTGSPHLGPGLPPSATEYWTTGRLHRHTGVLATVRRGLGRVHEKVEVIGARTAGFMAHNALCPKVPLVPAAEPSCTRNKVSPE
jgi:hypothetical protein